MPSPADRVRRPEASTPGIELELEGRTDGPAGDVRSAILKAIEAQAAGMVAKGDFRLKFGLVTADGKEY